MEKCFVGADVHAATTTFHVLDEAGIFREEAVVPTTQDALLEYLAKLPRPVALTFEEGTQAQWLHDLLVGRVYKLVVSNPAKNRSIWSAKPNDSSDAHMLAELLRANLLSPVFHDYYEVQTLKELVRAYRVTVTDRSRVKNRVKAVFRGQGLRCTGTAVFGEGKRGDWLDMLTNTGLRHRATGLFDQLDFLDACVGQHKVAVKQELSKHAIRHLLQSVPGIGMLNSAILISQVGSPRRFPNKRAFWAYCGLAVRSRSSGNFKVVDGALVRNHKSMQTRGLNRNRNAALKEVFKSAATTACKKPEFQCMREKLLDRGIPQTVAMVNVARKLATIVLTVWKKGEKYDATKMTESEAVQSPGVAGPS